MISRRQAARLVLSAGISLFILALMLNLTSGHSGQHAGVMQVVRSISGKLMLVYILFQLGQTLFRSERYYLLLRASGEPDVPRRWHVLLVTAARNMFVDMLPARTGELSYIAMLNRGCRVSGRACLSSFSIAFVFDFVALLSVLLVFLVLPVLSGNLRGLLFSVALVLVALVLFALFALFAGLRIAVRVLEKLPSRLREKGWVHRPIHFLRETAEAIETTRRARVFWPTLLLSLGVRTCKYVGLYFIFLAVVSPSFPDLAEASFGQVLLSLFSAEAAASLPVPTFMSFGSYEAGGLMTLTALGFTSAASAVAMLAIHIATQSVDYTLGGLGLLLFVFTGPRASDAPRAARLGDRARLALAAAVTAVIAAIAARSYLAAHAPAGETGPRAESPAPEETGLGVEGFIVWSSNRAGTHDIHLRKLPGGKTRRLTRSSHTDTYPRISPDGRQVVFCRSREPWVSQRNPVPWDVYVVDVARGKERRLAEFGNTPTWSADGRTVYFQRQGGTLVALDLRKKSETVLFSGGRNGLPDGIQLQTPSYGEKRGQLAVTLRGSRLVRVTALVPRDGKMKKVGGGDQCQLTWSPGEDFLYMVGHGGRQKNRIYRYDPDRKATTPWLDLPGVYSHEYFPRLSNDGRYLVLAASTGEKGQHEHDTSDYEVFAWPVGQPADQAVRITHNPANDCWPDIWIRP